MNKSDKVLLTQYEKQVDWLKGQVSALQRANLDIAKAYAIAYAEAVGKFAPEPAPQSQSWATSNDGALQDRFTANAAADFDHNGDEKLLAPVDPDRVERRMDTLEKDEEDKETDADA